MVYVVIIGLAFLLFVWAAYVLMDGHIFWSAVETSAPTTFPFILETMLIPTKGDKRWVRVDMYPDRIEIRGGRPTTVLANIQMSQVVDVIIQNRSADGLPMAGLSLTTTRGQFIFWSEGFNAPNKMKRAANVIRVLTDSGVKVRDLDIGKLTPDNIVHNR